jgi:pyruvate,orthophosphate dikinase
VGVIAFDPDLAERWAREEGKNVILVRPETRPDDVHGMLAAKGVVTSKGGRTSHAALVARQFGKPAVVGVEAIEIDLDNHLMRIGDSLVIEEGDSLSIDGNDGSVYHADLPTVVPDIQNSNLLQILSWADEFRRLGVRANADYPDDARRAREYGAEGIGLCRTEHMFFQEERLPIMQRMITAGTPTERAEAIAHLLPMQRSDFEGLFRAMEGQPVIIRLLDPPLHEFLPSEHDLMLELTDLKLRMQHLSSLKDLDQTLEEIESKSRLLERVEALQESNPMLGTRGVRLGMLIPGLYKMQVRAIFEAASRCAAEGLDVRPEVMIPLVSHVGELDVIVDPLREIADKIMTDHGVEIPYLIGTMIEIPRAALTAGEIARTAEFFSFGTNDLTQTTYGISRDDAETGFAASMAATPRASGCVTRSAWTTSPARRSGCQSRGCQPHTRRSARTEDAGHRAARSCPAGSGSGGHRTGRDQVSSSASRARARAQAGRSRRRSTWSLSSALPGSTPKMGRQPLHTVRAGVMRGRHGRGPLSSRPGSTGRSAQTVTFGCT